MREDAIKFWVEKSDLENLGFVYQTEATDLGTYVSIVKGGSFKDGYPLHIGKILKQNRRGITFRSYSIDSRGTDVFLSRGLFDELDQDEYEIHLKTL